MSHPVVTAVERELDKSRERLEQIQSQVATTKAALRDLETQERTALDESKKLEQHLYTTRRIFEPDEAEAAPQIRVRNELYTKFRVWCARNGTASFSAAMVQESLGVSIHTARKLVALGVQRGLLIEAGTFRPEGFKGGKLPMGYRYREGNKDVPKQPPAAPGKTADAVPGTGTGSAGLTRAVHKDVKAIISKAIKQQGAEVVSTGGGHLRLTLPGKHPVVLPDSAGGRALRNLKRDMRNAGYAL